MMQITVSSDRIIECLGRNQLGDSELFQMLNKDKFIFDHSAGRWMQWQGHYWSEDKIEAAEEAVRGVAGIYEAEMWRVSRRANDAISAGNRDAKAEALEKALRKRINDLRCRSRVADVLLLARQGYSGLATDGANWDKKPTLLAVLNGVVDLANGIAYDGNPSDMLITHANARWEGDDAPCPTFRRFIGELFDGDDETINFVQRLLGYCASGLMSERILPVFYGANGQNGKGTLLETLHRVLGDFTAEIPSETLLDGGKDVSGASARPDLMSLRGKRLCWCSETNRKRMLDSAKSKWLTGGDTIVCRPLYGQMTSFEPTAKIIMLSNFRPMADGSDNALWYRLVLVPFNLSFVENPTLPHERQRDANLQEKLVSEGSGILAWLWAGFFAWQQHGLCPPDSVRAATEEFRNENDSISQFLAEKCLIMPGVRVKAADIYESYQSFCSAEGLNKEGVKSFSSVIKNKFSLERNKSGRWYIGVAMRLDDVENE